MIRKVLFFIIFFGMWIGTSVLVSTITSDTVGYCIAAYQILSIIVYIKHEFEYSYTNDCPFLGKMSNWLFVPGLFSWAVGQLICNPYLKCKDYLPRL
jgi:hypothetical protein